MFPFIKSLIHPWLFFLRARTLVHQVVIEIVRSPAISMLAQEMLLSGSLNILRLSFSLSSMPVFHQVLSLWLWLGTLDQIYFMVFR